MRTSIPRSVVKTPTKGLKFLQEMLKDIPLETDNAYWFHLGMLSEFMDDDSDCAYVIVDLVVGEENWQDTNRIIGAFEAGIQCADNAKILMDLT